MHRTALPLFWQRPVSEAQVRSEASAAPNIAVPGSAEEQPSGEGAEVTRLFSASSDVFWGLSLWDFAAVAKERKQPAEGECSSLSYSAASGSSIQVLPT